jgi:hypothetical protein
MRILLITVLAACFLTGCPEDKKGDTPAAAKDGAAPAGSADANKDEKKEEKKDEGGW